MPLKWDLPPPSKRRAKPKRNLVQSIALGDGWTLYESKAAALGQTDARAVARAVRAGLRERAWAVRGEVPLEDDTQRVRLHDRRLRRHPDASAREALRVLVDGAAPRGVGRRAVLRRRERAAAVGGALARADRRPARRPARVVGLERRDVAAAQRVGGVGVGGDDGVPRREEWDWSYRTDYAGTAHAGAAAAGLCERRVAVLEEHRLICAARKRPKADTEAAEAALPWAACSAEDAEAAEGGAAAWADAVERPPSARSSCTRTGCRSSGSAICACGCASLSTAGRCACAGGSV